MPASMLGWRHDSDGACSAWVRVEFAGVVEDAWVELSRLRLPESPARHLSLARRPGTTGSAAAAAGSAPAETQQLPLVRDGAATPAPAGRRIPPGGGRRRAPETGELVAAPTPVPGRHRAPAEQGRHRAADTGLLAAVPAAAPIGAPVALRPVRSESLAALAGIDTTSAPPPRSELPPAGPAVRGQSAREVSTERLTRPMRLEEGVGPARRPRRDSLGV